MGNRVVLWWPRSIRERLSAASWAGVVGVAAQLAACGDDFSTSNYACYTNDHCATRAEGRVLCDVQLAVCVQCLGSGDCDSGEECVAGTCSALSGCQSAGDCSGSEHCDTESGACVECLEQAHCGEGRTCVNSVCRGQCGSGETCESGTVCDSALGLCVDCILDGDCAPEEHCAIGQCRTDVCQAGETSCSDNSVVECSVSGSGFLPATSCGVRQTCVESAGQASCRDWVCSPGARECESSSVAIECSADGLEVVLREDCSLLQQFCNAGQCSDYLCEPNARFCEDGSSVLCSADGLMRTVTECEPTQYCAEAGGECTAQVCTPNAAVCNDNVATTCNAEGSGYTDGGMNCGSGGCQAGTCASVILADDFEDGNFADWVKRPDYALTGVVSSAAAANGSGLGLSLTGGGAPYSGIYKAFGPAQPSYASFWVRVDTASAKTAHFFLMSDNIWVTYVLITVNNTFATNGGTLTNFSPNQWFHVEIHVDWTTKTADFDVDGVPVALDLPLRDLEYTYMNGLHLFTETPATVHWDEIEIR